MKKPITLVSSISIVLFLIAIIWFGAGIYADKKGGTTRANTRYENLLNSTKSIFAADLYGTSEFSNTFIKAIGNIDDFSSLKLEVNGTLIYSYPPTSFPLPSPELVKSFADSVNIKDKNFTLKASIYLMTPGSIYNHSRIAFVLILIGTIVAGVFIIFTNGMETSLVVTQSKERKYRRKEPSNEDSKELISEHIREPANTKDDSNQPQEKDASQNPEIKIQKEEKEEDESYESDIVETPLPTLEFTEKTISFNDYDSSDDSNEDEPDHKPIFNPEDIFAELEEENPAPAIKDNDSETIPAPKTEEKQAESFPQDSPIHEEKSDMESSAQPEESDDVDIIDQMEQENQSLLDEDFFKDKTAEEENRNISPVTNLFIQAAMEEMLDEAIKDSQQVTLSLVKINGLDRGNSISQNIIAILKQNIPASELFEYKADSYAAVMKKTDLQNAVDIFERIYNKMEDFLKDNNAVNEVSIGLSAVSGRNVKAERIILEASQALDYASQDPDSPIVAFRANPEKYQEYVEESEKALTI